MIFGGLGIGARRRACARGMTSSAGCLLLSHDSTRRSASKPPAITDRIVENPAFLMLTTSLPESTPGSAEPLRLNVTNLIAESAIVTHVTECAAEFLTGKALR